MFYILDGKGVPILAPTESAWMGYMSKHASIAQDMVGLFVVSTIFTGITHPWSMTPLFETLILNAAGEVVYMEKHKTLDDARLGHTRAFALAGTL